MVRLLVIEQQSVLDIRWWSCISWVKSALVAVMKRNSTEPELVVKGRRITSTCLIKFWLQPKEPELCSTFIKRVTPPTNHINHVICLIRLHKTVRNHLVRSGTEINRERQKRKKVVSPREIYNLVLNMTVPGQKSLSFLHHQAKQKENGARRIHSAIY